MLRNLKAQYKYTNVLSRCVGYFVNQILREGSLMRVFYVFLVATLIIYSCGKKESEPVSIEETDVCQGHKGELIEQSTGTEDSSQEVAENIVPDTDIVALNIEGPRAKVGKLFCLRITLKDANGKAIKAKEGGQIITFNSDKRKDNVRLLHLDFADSKAIPVLKLKVKEGQESVVLSDLITFDFAGKLQAELGNAKGELEVGIIINKDDIIPVESMTFTEAGSNKIAIKLQAGFTLPAGGYDAYFMNDNDASLIATAEGITARPALSETETHITFSEDVTGDNHIIIIYGEHKNMYIGGEAICPYVGENQKCPEHVTD